MNLSYITQNAIVHTNLVFRPQLTPVDYCGLLAYTAELCLSDGRVLRASSFELPEGGDENERCVDTIALLSERVAQTNLRPRCDLLDIGLTLAYRNLCGLPAPTWLVSACLAGECCRYDGTAQPNSSAVELVASGQGIPICPELSGGLCTPREPCERHADRVLARDGTDCTSAFLAGANLAAKAARLTAATHALLKEKSPSCGVRRVYDGSFAGVTIPGEGLTAAALRTLELTLLTEEDFQ